MNRYKKLTEDINSDKEFNDALFEYAGANELLDIKKYKNELKPFVKRMTCYRFWQEFNGDDVKEYLMQVKKYFVVRPRSYYACTKSFDLIKDLIEDFDPKYSTVISEHTGNVIDIVECMKSIIKKDNDPYYKDVYRRFAYQQEVLYIDSIRKLDEDNIIAYYDGSMLIPL